MFNKSLYYILTETSDITDTLEAVTSFHNILNTSNDVYRASTLLPCRFNFTSTSSNLQNSTICYRLYYLRLILLAESSNITDTIDTITGSKNSLDAFQDIINRSCSRALVPGRLNFSNTSNKISYSTVCNWMILFAESSNITDTCDAFTCSKNSLDAFQGIINRSCSRALVPGSFNFSNTANQVSNTAVNYWFLLFLLAESSDITDTLEA